MKKEQGVQFMVERVRFDEKTFALQVLKQLRHDHPTETYEDAIRRAKNLPDRKLQLAAAALGNHRDHVRWDGTLRVYVTKDRFTEIKRKLARVGLKIRQYEGGWDPRPQHGEVTARVGTTPTVEKFLRTSYGNIPRLRPLRIVGNRSRKPQG